MSYLIDTHCHLHDRETYEFALGRSSKSSAEDIDVAKILNRARAAGVLQLICIGTSHEDSLRAHDFAAQHKDVFWTYGIHPDEAETSKSHCNIPSEPIAIGEVGLDYRNGTGNRDAQIQLFEEMLQLAVDHDLPLVFHVREAFDDFFAVLKNFPDLPAVIHSFSDNIENLHKSLDHNFHIGVNGLATFADLPTPPLEKIILETDAPFLTPVPNRGKINESAYVPDIAHYLANKLGVSDAKIADITTANAKQLFRLPSPVLRPARGL